ncbi:MAG: TauD/TfdA family dioxygenase [Pseudomonadota bacterium]
MTAALEVSPHANNFGACVRGIDLRAPLTEATVADLRQLWLRYQIIYFPDQPLAHVQLETFTRYFGPFGNDPYVKAVDGHQHILEVRREPSEQVTPFGSSWHSDWSFQANPPSATILHAKVVPPLGGDTHYADGVRAYEALDASLRDEIDTLVSLHSARRPYSHEGYRRSGGDRRSMTILPDDNAWDVQAHPLVRTHAESGRKSLWINPVYTIGIQDMADSDADKLLQRLFNHALQPEFIYTHKWAPQMLTMWDNRTVQHCAQGGYDGYLRVMHRTTVAGERPC